MSDLASLGNTAWNRSINQVTEVESEWNLVTKNERGRNVSKQNESIDSISLEEERQIGGVNNFKGE